MPKQPRRVKGSLPQNGLVRTDNYISKETMDEVRKKIPKINAMKKFAAGVSVTQPTFYNPLYTPTSLQLPRDRKQINVWLRHFYNTEAIPAAVIDLYAALPITDFSVECENPHVKKEMEEMLDRLNMRELFQGVALEYFLIGDVFVMGELDHNLQGWKKFTILNPDQVEVRRNMLADEPVIEMIPDEELKGVVFTHSPREIFQYLNTFLPDVVKLVGQGKNIPLDPKHVTHFRHMPIPYGVYGTPLMKRVFKTLMYKEMIRRAQFTIAERYVMPLKIFKVGTMDEPPPPEEIAMVQDQLAQVINDPTTVMVTTQRLQADWQGISGKTLQLAGEYDFIERELIAGLGISRAFLDGLGPTYANASIGGNAFLQKLENFRLMLKQWVEKRVFQPICEWRGYYDRDPDTDQPYLIKPKFKWDALRLQDEASRQQAFLQLRTQNAISAKTLLEAFHIDPETEEFNLKEERDTVFDPNRVMLRQLLMQNKAQLAGEMDMMKMQQEMGGMGMGMGMDPSMMGGMMPGQEAAPAAGNAAGEIPTDQLSGFGGPALQTPGSGALFAPLDRATSRPPVATAALNNLMRKVNAILAEPDEEDGN